MLTTNLIQASISCEEFTDGLRVWLNDDILLGVISSPEPVWCLEQPQRNEAIRLGLGMSDKCCISNNLVFASANLAAAHLVATYLETTKFSIPHFLGIHTTSIS
jgi:hypothetical protein